MESTNERPYLVKVTVSGDEAEADDLRSALLAASTLVEDYREFQGRQGSAKAARASIYIIREGIFDGLATTLAREGRCRP